MDNTQKPNIAALIEHLRLQTQPESISNEFLAGLLAAINEQKVDTEENKGLSTEDFTSEMMDLINPDWYGTQAQYNALPGYTDHRWYFIELDGEVVAVYRGSQLITAIPNMVGEFSADSTEEDWYWYPNDIKTPIPVDPATLKFSYYFPIPLTSAAKLFIGAEKTYANLKRLEVIPPLVGDTSVNSMLNGLQSCEVMPVIDLRGRKNYAMYIALLNTKDVNFSRLVYTNTSGCTALSQFINIGYNTGNTFKALMGVDMSSAVEVTSLCIAYNSNGPAYIQITNLGKAKGLTACSVVSKNWGDDTIFPRSRQSLVDALLTYSFDRAAAGYPVCSITLHADCLARLTAAEVSAINAKGYTLVTA